MNIILMGATGDLCKRKLIPALYNLLESGSLLSFAIVGAGLEDATTEQIFEHARPFVKNLRQETWRQLQDHFVYVQMDFHNSADYAQLNECIQLQEQTFKLSGNRLFFLATMPELFSSISQFLSDHHIVKREDPARICNGGACAWERVIYEKPFGKDLHSAQAINQKIADVFSERQAYRIDHYLGKELVGNIALMRFANAIFQPLWNNQYIESVQIVLKESFGIENRGLFYEQYGAIKDVVQNHMMQLVALIAMEPPHELAGEHIRNAKVEVLSKTSVVDVLLGQYEGYHDERDVKKDSPVETFAALQLAIDNDRWRGVPFYLKTGKALNKKNTSIHITFKKGMSLIPEQQQASNVLTINIEPNEGFVLHLNGKAPGKSYQTTPVNLKFSHRAILGANTPQAYEVLLLDAMRGDQSVFVRFDEIEQSWNIIDAIARQQLPVHRYKKGSRGPTQLAAWSRKVGVKWLD